MALDATHIVLVDTLITAKVVDDVIRICKIVETRKDEDMFFVNIQFDYQLKKLKELPYVVKVYENPQFKPFSPNKTKEDNHNRNKKKH